MSSKKSPWILGISASHNGSVCLLQGDEIVVAVQEERLTGFKRQRIYASDSSLAAAYCLSYAGIEPGELDLVVVCIQGRARDVSQDIRLNRFLNVVPNHIPAIVIPHHYGHALSAFATSGFPDAAILVVDGTGSPFVDLAPEEQSVVTQNFDAAWETISLYSGSGAAVTPLEKHLVEHGAWLRMDDTRMPEFGSLGGMFSAVAQQIFGDPMEAGKVMGLAPVRRTANSRQQFFRDREQPFPLQGFGVRANLTMANAGPRAKTNTKFSPPRSRPRWRMLYCTWLRRLRSLCPGKNLCYAGGVALNSVANERIIRESGFENVYIMPAADDSGPAVGAAYYGLWGLTQHNSQRRLVHDACGRPYSSASVDRDGRARRSFTKHCFRHGRAIM